jgi:predicted ATPase
MTVADTMGEILTIRREEDRTGVDFLARYEDVLDGEGESLFAPFSRQGLVRVLSDQELAPTELLLSQLGFAGGILSRIRRRFAQTKVYQLSARQARKTGVPTPGASLSRYGENLPAVADYLSKHREESWNRIQEAMRSLIPRLLNIETRHTEERLLALQFREAGVRRAWSASEMSDGTIQALALFTAIFDGRSPLLLIEEPENSLHPWILRQFIDLCRYDDKKQILLTTHSSARSHLPLKLSW